jgi:protein-S-isoprenylcysteine O-methyltransferase Ste14
VIVSASSPERATGVNARPSSVVGQFEFLTSYVTIKKIQNWPTTPSSMSIFLDKAIRSIAIAVLAFEMPVPIYWLMLHTPVAFWRRHMRAAFPVAVLIAWGAVDFVLYRFRLELFRHDVSFWPALLGAALIGFDVFAFCTSEAVLGGHRIVGHSELAGSRELIARGLYARVRHPRYLGMMAGVFGSSLILASAPLWAASLVWQVLALLSIHAEERELRARLGPVYAAYAEQVPALLPLRWRPRKTAVPSGREHRS